MTTATSPRQQRNPLGEPSIINKDEMMAGMMGSNSSGLRDNGTSLIARAEALNAFMKMQPAADQARHQPSSAPVSPVSSPPPTPNQSSCFCFGTSRSSPRKAAYDRDLARPKREYYPDNLSVQPERHPWTKEMEWLILACVDFLEVEGLAERNIFAVSAVDDLVRNMSVQLGHSLPQGTDPHVAAGVIKAQIRHANEPLVSKDCLRAYIEHHTEDTPSKLDGSYVDSHLAKTISAMESTVGAGRAYVLARIMRLLGRVSANEEVSKMNAHCLAKCVAPSMLHWDPNSGFALLMLGKITAFVMTMIEDARVFDEPLCQKIADLHAKYR